MTKVKILILGIIVVGLGAGVTAVILHIKGRENLASGASAKKAGSGPVKLVHPRKGAVERLSVQPCSVDSFKSIHLFAQVAGFLKTQKVDIGDPVKEGAVLAVVDVPDIEAQVERNTAAAAQMQAQLLQMKSRLKAARANLKAVEAAVAQAKATQRAAAALVKFRTIEHQRLRELADANSIEERLYDQKKDLYETAVEAATVARAKIAITEADVSAGQARIEQAQADVAEAEAQIKVVDADLKKSQVNLGFATITAPFAGVITYRSMNPGDFVRAANGGANIDPLLTVRRTDLFRVVVLIPDGDVEPITVGMPAMVKIDSLPRRTFYPKVSRMGKTLDTHTRLMRVELDLFNDKDGKICHGMYGQVTIVLDKLPEKLSIPIACIAGKIENGKGSVFVIRAGRAKKIELKFGTDSAQRVVVEKVLTPGEVLTQDDQVIFEPSSDLARQPEVTATPWDDSSTIKLTQIKE